MLFCSNGDHFEKAKLTVRKAGKKPLEYLVMDMKKVLITSVSTGGSGGEDRLTENITLNFAALQVKYKEQNADGSAGAEKIYTWDIAQNTGQ